MTLRKISDTDKKKIVDICIDPEHDPPMHMSLSPGQYEWECPRCHKIQKFTVTGAYLQEEHHHGDLLTKR